MVTMGNQEFYFDSFPKLINFNCLSKSVPTSIYGSYQLLVGFETLILTSVYNFSPCWCL
jgi:hypothetical protein